MNYCIIVDYKHSMRPSLIFFTAFICPKLVIKVKVLIIPLFTIYVIVSLSDCARAGSDAAL